MTAAVRHLGSGKVRELYDAGDDRLVLVASDRMSAFDVVMPTPIPDKGRVLTGLSLFWFARTADIVPNHLLSARLEDLPGELRGPSLAGRVMLCRRLEMLPVECVVRGYLAGSGWKDYRATGAVCGHVTQMSMACRFGMRRSMRCPENSKRCRSAGNNGLAQRPHSSSLSSTRCSPCAAPQKRQLRVPGAPLSSMVSCRAAAGPPARSRS